MGVSQPLPSLDWSAVAGCFDDPIYGNAKVADLINAVGRPPHANGLRPERLMAELRDATASFAFARYHELMPSLSAQDAQMSKFAQALQLALETVGFSDRPELDKLLPMFGRGALFAAAAIRGEASGADSTMKALYGVWQLQQDARTVREIFAKRQGMKPSRRGRQEERAIKRLAAQLSSIYWLTWLESPGVALTEEGNPNSPFMRLFMDVRNSLRERIGEPRQEAPALAQVWHRLPDDEKLKFRSSWPPTG